MVGSHEDLISELDCRKTPKQKAHPNQNSSNTPTLPNANCYFRSSCLPFGLNGMTISLPNTSTMINPVTATITKHNIDTQKERLNCIAVKARNAMNASLTQKLNPQHQT
jgi:hypothetical protein